MRHALHSGLPTSGSCVLLNIRWKWHTSGSLEGEPADEGFTMKVLCAGNWGRQAPQIWKKTRPVTPEGSGRGPHKASKFLIFGALITPSVEPSHSSRALLKYRDELRPGIPPQGELALRESKGTGGIHQLITHSPRYQQTEWAAPHSAPYCLLQRGNSTRFTQSYFSHGLSTEGSLWGTSLTSVRSLKGTRGCEMEIERGIHLLRIIGNVIQIDSKIRMWRHLSPGWSKCWKSLEMDLPSTSRCGKS